MTLAVKEHFSDRKKIGTIAWDNSTKLILKEIMTPVVRGHFRDRNKTGTIALDDSTQQIRLLQVTISVDTFAQHRVRSLPS